MTLTQMSLSFIFLPDSRKLFTFFFFFFQDCHVTVVQHLCECRSVNSPNFCGDRFATPAQMLYDCSVTGSQQICDVYTNNLLHKFTKNISFAFCDDKLFTGM